MKADSSSDRPETTEEQSRQLRAPDPHSAVTDLFVKILVAGVGIILGGIAALIISLMAGWVPIIC